MAHVLSNDEALAALRLESADDCPNLEMLLNAVDDGLKTETGYDWSQDAMIDPTAKLAASIALVALNEESELPKGYHYKVTQLDAKAKKAAAT